MLLRTQKGKPHPKPPLTRGEARERNLHEAIEAELRRRGWYYVHSRMDKRTTTAVGVPDFIAAAPGGRTIWIEAKARNEKPTKEQAAAHCWLRKHGHVVIVARSLEQVINEIGI